MALVWEVRIKCLTETGDGKGFHYCYHTQTELDENVKCTDHPTANVEHFVIEDCYDNGE